MAKKMTRQETEKLKELLRGLGFGFGDYVGKGDGLGFIAHLKEGNRNVGEWCTITKVDTLYADKYNYWVTVKISVYRYEGAETLNMVTTQTRISKVWEFERVFGSRGKLLELRGDFNFE